MYIEQFVTTAHLTDAVYVRVRHRTHIAQAHVQACKNAVQGIYVTCVNMFAYYAHQTLFSQAINPNGNVK